MCVRERDSVVVIDISRVNWSRMCACVTDMSGVNYPHVLFFIRGVRTDLKLIVSGSGKDLCGAKTERASSDTTISRRMHQIPSDL